MDSPLVAGMTPEHEATLREAGIDSLPTLAAIEPKAVSDATGIRPAVLASYRELARDRIQAILQQAGVSDLPSLAAANVEEISARTGLWMATVEEYRDAARTELWSRFRAAGVDSPAALALHENLDELEKATEVPRSWLEHFREEARRESAAGPVQAEAPAQDAPRDPRSAYAPRAIDRIVLDESMPYALVVVRGVESWGVRVTALPGHADEHAAAKGAGAYAVVLKEGEPTGLAVVDGRVHAALPLYERVYPPGLAHERFERRVRVAALRRP